MHKVLQLFNNFKLLLLYLYGYIINNPDFNITLTPNYAFTILYFEPIFHIIFRNLLLFSIIIKINVDLAAMLMQILVYVDLIFLFPCLWHYKKIQWKKIQKHLFFWLGGTEKKNKGKNSFRILGLLQIYFLKIL